jgi:sterol desaturase/sphingolipid hydroxylase (fatty acid hydroxylase superfamily)
MLENALSLLFAAEQRVFLPFLVTSALIAALVWARHVRGRRSLVSYLFPRSVWLHSSSLLDLRIIVTRGLLALVLFVPTFLSTIAVAVAIARVLRHTFGITSLATSATTVLVLFTVAAFIADDLTRYVVHRVMHRVPALWELHKVHHSAEVLTPFTLYRVHPLEGFAMAVRSAVTLGVVTGLFMWLFPGRVRGIHVLGVDVIGFLFALAGANLRHSQVWLSYGPTIEKLLISPAQHQIHHSVDPQHHDRNFGASLAIWDWLFGSLYVTRAREKLKFGLGAEKNHKDTVASVLVDPVTAILTPSRRAASTKELVAVGDQIDAAIAVDVAGNERRGTR